MPRAAQRWGIAFFQSVVIRSTGLVAQALLSRLPCPCPCLWIVWAVRDYVQSLGIPELMDVVAAAAAAEAAGEGGVGNGHSGGPTDEPGKKRTRIFAEVRARGEGAR